MSNTVKIHGSKTPTRRHFIAEWAEHRDLSAAELVRETGIDRVSMWRYLKGRVPRKEEHLEAFRQAFELDDIESLFRDPSRDWLNDFFEKRSREELERVRSVLNAMFPEDTQKKTG